MTQFLKYSGIILVIIGVIVLGIYAINTPSSNTPLAISALLLIGGLVLHIVLNRIIE